MVRLSAAAFLSFLVPPPVVSPSPTSDVPCTAGPDGEGDCRAAYFERGDVHDDDIPPVVDEYADIIDIDDYFLNAWECVDTSDPEIDCPSLAISGECENNPGFAKYRCALSCGTCIDFDAAYNAWRDGETNIGPCTDEYVECKNWAAMGECGYNPPFMLVECKRSWMVCFEDT